MARSSDRHYERSYHAMVGAALVFLGYLLLLLMTGRSGLYVAVCIAVSGIFVINPVVNAWLTSNIAPSMKKSVATAMAVSANNSAGLLGSHIYQRDDAPRYRKILIFPNICA
jgi:predicted MFS family arabinose efflux permease